MDGFTGMVLEDKLMNLAFDTQTCSEHPLSKGSKGLTKSRLFL